MQPSAHKIFSNTVWQGILRVVEIFIGVVTLGLITRYLSPDGFGSYTTVNALLQFFIIIIDFGLYLTLLREISASSPEQIEHATNNIVTMRATSTALLLCLAITVISFTGYPAEIKLGMASLAAAYFFASLISTLTALFQRYLQMVKIATLNVITKVVLLGFVLVIQSKNLGLQSILLASSLSSAISFVLLWRLLSTLPSPVRLRFRFDFGYWRTVISKAWPLAVTTALNLVYFKADTVILSAFRSSAEVGIYGAGYRVLEILTTFPHMFMGLILPVLTAAWVARDYTKLNRVWEKAFTFFALLTLPLVAGALVVATPVMVLIAGSEFAMSGTVLKLLMIATALIFFGTLYTYTVLVIEEQRRIIKYFLVTAVISLAGYLVLIPRFSYWGAAGMTIASEALIIAGAWLTVRPHLKLSIPWGVGGKLVLASALMGLYTAAAQNVLPLIPLLATSALVYGGLVLALRAVSFQELKNLIKP